ncbi:MAG TPA: alpha/beta hydrolase [Methanoregulaceae archaeon]|nr:alpha/beta hydrolase [Methanoregulaceae archaeon]
MTFPLHDVVIAAIILLSCTAGCLSAPPQVTNDRAPPGTEYPPLSIREAPVRYADVNGVRLAYREFGSGEPLLVIVGFGATMEQANDTAISVLAAHYHVFLYDHRGMGHSGTGNETPTIPMYADDAASLIPALGHESMHVYGTSMGSFIAQELALNHPDRVRKMILDSSAYSIRVPETRYLRDYMESVAADTASPPGTRDEARAMLAWNGTEDRLTALHKDVLLVVGTEDTITPPALSYQMAGKVNGSWLVRFEGLPHAGGDVAPVAYGRTAVHFLQMDTSG